MPSTSSTVTILHTASTEKDYLHCSEGDLIDAAIRLAWARLPKKCFECPPNRFRTQILSVNGIRTHVVLNNFSRGEVCRFKIAKDRLELVDNADNSGQGGVAALPEIHKQAKKESRAHCAKL